MTEILTSLRSLMTSHSPPLDALVVPSEDNHQSEYVSARDKRREFVTGFTGSAGLAVITLDKALLWTDGRYFLQAKQQLSDKWTLMRIGEDPAVDSWMADNLNRGASIGIDPWCVSVDTAQRWGCTLQAKGLRLVQTENNLVDEVWKDRPSEKISPIIVHPLKFSGCSVEEKLNALRKTLEQKKARAIIITTLDEVAWLYNIRGNDVPYCPVVHAFAIATLEASFIYVDKRKLTDEAIAHFKNNGIDIREYADVSADVTSLSSGQLEPSFSTGKNHAMGSDEIKAHSTQISINQTGAAAENNCGRVWVDPVTCCLALHSKLKSSSVLSEHSPIALAKALKNSVELDGLRNAHIRDGAAVVQFLVWLDKQMQETHGASGYFLEEKRKNPTNPNSEKWTEVTVSDKLESFRASKENFRGLSFSTISSVGPNAAVIHYSPEAETCAEFDPDKIYLFDSGAQYSDGTTDITRTIHLGVPSSHEKICYTAVLKGHIALDSACFPNGTNGNALDILARVPLWRYGLDYRHGTGHGIGSFLNVHEGPQLISFRPQAQCVPLQASMTVTDEPGYYEDGNFGIRLENVLIINDADTEFNFGDKGYLSFEHITWVPYQTKLMDLSLLMHDEIDWLNRYHARCRELLAPYMSKSEMVWLRAATEPIVAACN